MVPTTTGAASVAALAFLLQPIFFEVTGRGKNVATGTSLGRPVSFAHFPLPTASTMVVDYYI
jgi:hypothetical protein